MKSTFDVWTVQQIVTIVSKGKLHPNPIGQRPPVTGGYSKSMGIVLSCLNGYGIGMITMRDIRNDNEMQEVYPGVDYLVIDGGHRVRALFEYYSNKFRIHGKFYKEDEGSFETIQVPVDIKKCSSRESIEIFRNVNETTSVNPIEMIMCDDQSQICKDVRSLTSYYKEYNNSPHTLFEAVYDKHQKHVSRHFNTTPNPRREWDKYVFVAIHKTLGKGNVDAGEKNTEELIRQEYEGNNQVTKTVLKNVERFLSDVLDFQYNRKSGTGKLNGDIFSAFQLTWFALYERNHNFKITSMYTFHERFMRAYAMLTGKVDTTFNNKMIFVENGKHAESINIKEFFRKNMKNFANGAYQRKCAELIMELLDGDIGVTFRDDKRSITTAEREERLALQGYRCAIDGFPLSLEDSVWGHDVAWAEGGNTSEGAVIRASHNSKMGTMTIKQYKNANELDLSEEELNLILNLRKKSA